MKFTWPLIVGVGGRKPEDGSEALGPVISQASEAFELPMGAQARAQARMRTALQDQRAGPRAVLLPTGSPRKPRLRFNPVMSALIAGGVIVAGSVGAGVLGGRHGPAGLFGSGSAEAVVLSGTLEGQTADALILTTDQGLETIALGQGPVILDAVGNPIPIDSLVPGQSLSVRGKRDDHSSLVVEEIQATTEVRGRVQAMSTSSIQLAGERVVFTVLLTPSTRMEGPVRVGSLVEVEVGRDSSNNVVAVKVESEDESEDDHGDAVQAPTPVSGLAPAGQPTQPRGQRHDDDKAETQPAATTVPLSIPTASREPTVRPTEIHDSDASEHEGYPEGGAQQPSTPPPPPSATGSESEHQTDEEHEDEPEHEDEHEVKD